MRKMVLALILLFSLPLHGQSNTDSWVLAMTRYGLRGSWHAATAPQMRLHWAATAVGVLAASRFDDWATSSEIRPKIMSDIQAEFGDKWGDPTAASIALPAIFLADRALGYTPGERKLRLEFAVASLTSVGVITVVAKEVFRRPRPNGSNHRSFPSGHTSISFAVAEVSRQLYGNIASVPFYLLAVNTALSRIHDNKHYPSDVVAGAGLGIGIIRGFALMDGIRSPVRFSVEIGQWGIVGYFSMALGRRHR